MIVSFSRRNPVFKTSCDISCLEKSCFTTWTISFQTSSSHKVANQNPKPRRPSPGIRRGNIFVLKFYSVILSL